MTPYNQLVTHEPPHTFGDCMRTCYACLLEVSPESVPHFALLHWRDGMTDAERQKAERAYLREYHGMDAMTFLVADLRKDQFIYLPKALCIAGGDSPRHGDGHCVVWQWDEDGGHLVHDPHPSRKGLAGAPKDLTFLVPLNPAGRTA